MKLTRSFLAIVFSFSLSLAAFLVLPVQTANAQDTRVALQRGYRTGYSDGYMAGYRDSIDSIAKDYSRHGDYAKANRAYNKDYGTAEDYKDGYQQGFVSGYDTGFEKRSFEATVPADLNKRGVMAVNPPSDTSTVQEKMAAPVVDTPVAEAPAAVAENAVSAVSDSVTTDQPAPVGAIMQKTSFQPVSDAVIIIPRDTELIVELQEELTTDRNREGDKFTAKIVSPAEISGAIIEGRVSKIIKPGRLKRRSEMLLSFDRVILNETRWSNFNAILSEVLPSKGDNVKKVDNEGAAVGNRSFKEDGIKVGVATGTGIVVGAIAGGPVGAAVGAGVGAAFGVGAVVVERGKNINLTRSQQLRIKTSYETQIR